MSKKLIKFIRYDMKNGLLRKWAVYLFTVVAVLVATQSIYIVYRDKGASIDYIFGIFVGLPKYYISPETAFNVPFIWFVFMIIPAFLIGDYAVSDLNAYGIQLIVKSRSKISWWISKTIWCITSVVVYFAIIILVLGIYGHLEGKAFSEGTDTWCYIVGMYEELEMSTLVIHGIIGPFITILAMCMLQMVLSLYFGSLIAYVIVIAYDILSAYITYPIFIGNYAMLFRNDMYVADGLDFRFGMIIEALVIVASFVAGVIIMKKTALFKYSKNNGALI